jgi:tRNA nucleotidyltransferase (CCA-adding enzyme)
MHREGATVKNMQSKIPAKTLALLKKIGRLAHERGEAAYAVGGFVRDLFIGRPGVDIDITIEGDGIAFAESLAEKTGSRLEAFTRFGTCIVVVRGFGKLDVATARTESYERPGALPSVKKGLIHQDLYRRDFTINAMALALSPSRFLELLDPYNGLKDLEKGRVRALHGKSFIDDPTRIFRAVRFEQRFEKHIEPKTQKWLLEAVRGGNIRTVSGERLRNEFKLIFREPNPGKAVLRLDALGVMPQVHPALGLSVKARKFLPRLASAILFFRDLGTALEEENMVWFQALLSSPEEKQALSLCKRLMLSRSEQKIVTQSAKAYPSVLHELESEKLTASRIYKYFWSLKPEVRCFLLAAAEPKLSGEIRKYLVKIQKVKPWVRGRDLMALGIQPGFQYSFILLEALNGQLDGKFKNRKQVLDWIKKSFETGTRETLKGRG